MRARKTLKYLSEYLCILSESLEDADASDYDRWVENKADLETHIKVFKYIACNQKKLDNAILLPLLKKTLFAKYDWYKNQLADSTETQRQIITGETSPYHILSISSNNPEVIVSKEAEFKDRFQRSIDIHTKYINGCEIGMEALQEIFSELGVYYE